MGVCLQVHPVLVFEILDHISMSVNRVHLQTNAHIEQDGSVVDGDSIDYLMKKQLITAQSDQTRTGNKVVVVIPPSVQTTEDKKRPEEQPSAEMSAPPATEQLEESGSGRTTSE